MQMYVITSLANERVNVMLQYKEDKFLHKGNSRYEKSN